MKTIYATDIKAMVRKFSLTEDEEWYVNNIAHLVNQENTAICPSIQETLEHGSWAESRDNAIKAMICYFGAKAQKENDLHNAFDRTSRVIAGKLKCSAYDIRRWIMGMAYNGRSRFGRFIECRDVCGRNYLKID